MPYSVQYILRYKEINGDIIKVVLGSVFTSDDTINPAITLLTPATNAPFRVSVIDNDNNKFKVVRAKQADIYFIATSLYNASLFAGGPDNNWHVEATVESTGYVLFDGFLITDDIEQPLLSATTNQTVKLTAICGLGTLAEQPLTKPDGTNPRGNYKLIEYISWCLQKTGLQLDIIVTDTWMEQNNSTFAPTCDEIYLAAKTFEKDINVSVDCYRALEIILGSNSFITQHDGTWWIGHVDELQGGVTFRFQFDYQGTYIGPLATQTYAQKIGFTEELHSSRKTPNYPIPGLVNT
jgi:hypothetical protein